MDDPARAWPAWKFGMKRGDLFTTLHDQYNTFLYTIQDPEAFHHDVYEISRDADTAGEFHRMMADRRQMRLRELSESMAALAVEIIANPKLMGSKQWDRALQLFRTKSYDSIVRYFASYLPDKYLDRDDTRSTASSSSSYSEADSLSTVDSCVDQGFLTLADRDFFPDGPVMTSEPDPIDNDCLDAHRVCKSFSPPPSEASHSDASAASSPASDICSDDLSTHPPSPPASFCGSESGRLMPDPICQRYIGGGFEMLHCQGCDVTDILTADTAVGGQFVDDENNECGGISQRDDRDAHGFHNDEYEDDFPTTQYPDDDFPTTQYPDDDFDDIQFPSNSYVHATFDSDSPTSRAEAPFHEHLELFNMVSRKALSSRSLSNGRGTVSPPRDVQRSPEESSSRIQKPVYESPKKRRAAAKKG